MAREILDYSQFVQRESVTKDKDYVWNQEYFYAQCGFCPFCQKATRNPLRDIWRAGASGDYVGGSIAIWRCACGWWEVLESDGSVFFGDDRFEHTLSSAVLKKFGRSSLGEPLHALRSEVLARTDLLYSIEPKKMEQFVASIMEGLYDCDVRVCGRSHDGGIDLVLLNGESPTLVQVKRRHEGAKSESVAQIRHLLGSTLLKGGNRCAFVTTADHFSREARSAAAEAVKKNIVSSFELIDRNRLLEMLNLTTIEAGHHWQKVLRKIARYGNNRSELGHELRRGKEPGKDAW